MKFPRFFPPLFHPPAYQGRRRPKRYFEGWYNKVVSADGKQIWSFIPGISFSGDHHSFIQVIEGTTGRTDYIRFPGEAFRASRKAYRVQIGDNKLGDDGMEIALGSPQFEIEGKLKYNDVQPFPQRLFSPGIMGWYSYAPFMECYHGVVSMHHTLEGSLRINGSSVDFSGGKGYIEKDWGRSMPTDWVWIQCNHFEKDDGASLMISIARIPWMGSHFPGFLSFFRLNDTVYRFATYNGAAIEKLSILPDALDLVLAGKRNRLMVHIRRKRAGELKAPKHGEMNRKIHESLDAAIEVQLEDKGGQILFEARGEHAGLEIVGDVSQFL